MCGRYLFQDETGDERVRAILAMMAREGAADYKTGEIFPGDAAPALIAQGGALKPVPATFGFTGFDGKRLLINARCETAAQKPTFAQAMRTQRAVMPAAGFYEWSHDGRKTKYLFTLEGEQTIYLCGLYRMEADVCRFVVLTRAANESMADVHDRMPVIARAQDVRAFLTDYEAALTLIERPGPTLVRRVA